MTVRHHALVLAEDQADFEQWQAANHAWMQGETMVFFCSPDGSVPLRADGAEMTEDAARAMSDGFLLTRSDWSVDKTFGEIAAQGDFVLATGRLSARLSTASTIPEYEDIAPALIAADIEKFSISARYDGALCRRLPLECLWVGKDIAADALTLFMSGAPAATVIETLSVDQRLRGGGRVAYLADMKALWRRATSVKSCSSLRPGA